MRNRGVWSISHLNLNCKDDAKLSLTRRNLGCRALGFGPGFAGLNNASASRNALLESHSIIVTSGGFRPISLFPRDGTFLFGFRKVANFRNPHKLYEIKVVCVTRILGF